MAVQRQGAASECVNLKFAICFLFCNLKLTKMRLYGYLQLLVERLQIVLTNKCEHFPQACGGLPVSREVLMNVANVTIATLLLVLMAPIFAIIAVGIKLTSPGPILFRQQRYGRRGEVFTIFKFRTMVCMESGASAVQCRRRDPRVTMLGAMLRRASLDELPQLINVVRGDMAIVGPRPHPLGLDQQFAPRIRDFHQRYAVKPGLTGLAQIRGHRGPTESVEDMSRRIASDLEYVYRRSLLLDLSIMAKTIPAVALGLNAV